MILNILLFSFLIKVDNNYFFKKNYKNINNFKVNKYINIHSLIDNNSNFKKIITINNVNNINYYNNLILNELLFFFNKKTKVYIHLEQLFYKSNIYHIGISFHNIFNNVRYDIGLFENVDIGILNKDKKQKTIFWDYSNKSLSSIMEYEASLNYKYVLGIYDCRHYVRNLSQWSTNNPTPIWKLYTLY